MWLTSYRIIYSRIGMKKKPQDGRKDFLLINFLQLLPHLPRGEYILEISKFFPMVKKIWKDNFCKMNTLKFWNIFTPFVRMQWSQFFSYSMIPPPRHTASLVQATQPEVKT